jgi:predicted RNase H-like HicB family nuclease
MQMNIEFDASVTKEYLEQLAVGAKEGFPGIVKITIRKTMAEALADLKEALGGLK